ncbi:MAG TPA: potassium channel family protein [Micropepsaceae bacterium]|nr:potassium channel family protein [Micropepsaceae bacterium]
MVANLALGGVLIASTVFIHTAGLVLLADWMAAVVRWFKLHKHRPGQTFALMTTVLGLFFLHTLEIWLWAAVYAAIGVIGDFETALYFSTESFSTVGYGDVTPDPQWRLFAALESINGFILIGWSIAYLIAASTRHGPFRSGEHF